MLKHLILVMLLVLILFSATGCIDEDFRNKIQDPVKLSEQSSPMPLESHNSYANKIEQTKFSMIQERTKLMDIKAKSRDMGSNLEFINNYFKNLETKLDSELNYIYTVPVPNKSNKLSTDTILGLEKAHERVSKNRKKINYNNPELVNNLADDLIDIFNSMPSGLF